MKRGFVFWEEDLRVTGPGSMADAVARLRAQLSAGRLSMRERLAGSLDGARLRVWKASSLAQAGDTVEFEGSLQPAGGGTVIEGALRYKTATKVQFAGLLLIGLVLVAAGVFQKSGGQTLGGGVFIFLLSLLWIYSSARMRHEQIEFIEAKLREAVGADVQRAT